MVLPFVSRGKNKKEVIKPAKAVIQKQNQPEKQLDLVKGQDS